MFWFVFGFPLLTAGLEWVVLFTGRRDQRRHITVVFALLLTTASAFTGVWGLGHIEQLRQRAVDDYRYEGIGWLLAAAGMVAALPWIAVERKTWLAWLTLAIAGWMFVIWSLICSTY